MAPNVMTPLLVLLAVLLVISLCCGFVLVMCCRRLVNTLDQSTHQLRALRSANEFLTALLRDRSIGEPVPEVYAQQLDGLRYRVDSQ